MNIDFFSIILTACITGLGAGLGSTVSTWFSQKTIIRHLEKLETKIKRNKKGF